MLDFRHLDEAFRKFGRVVITQSRANLSRQKHNDTKVLYKSLGYSSRASKRSFEFDFRMEYYGMFLDQGVNGKVKKWGSPYTFKRQPPAEVFEKWAKRKGIKPRDRKTGKFISYKSLSYLIARAKLRDGQKPTHFFSKPSERHYNKL